MFEIIENPMEDVARQRHSSEFLVNPQPVNGDASFGVLLGHQRQIQDERRQGVDLDHDAAQLLPLMLSLARLSARAMVQGVAQ